MSELVVLSDDSAVCVAVAHGGVARELRRFPLRDSWFVELEEVRARHRVSVHEGRWVTELTHDGDHCNVLEWDGEALVPAGWFAVKDVRLHAVAIRGDRIYAGGARSDRDGDKLFCGAPRRGLAGSGQIALEPIALPERLRWGGKGIDAIVFDGARMIAVDNVFEPKWIVEYDLSDPASPRLVSTYDFSHPANSEVIVRAVLGPCLAIMAVQFDRTTLAFHDRATFAHVAGLAPSNADPDRLWRTIALVGSRLYVPANARGVGEIDLGVLATRGGRASVFPRPASEAAISYRPAPSGLPVKFITAATGGLFLQTPGHGGARCEWLPLP